MAALDAETLVTENKPPAPAKIRDRKAARLFTPQTFRLLIFVVVAGLILALLPGFVRSNKLPLPLLNNLQNPVRLDQFYPTESNGRDTFRWTAASAKIYLPEVLALQKITFEVAAAYPEGSPRPRLHLRYNNEEIANQLIETGWTQVIATFPSGLEAATGPLELVIENALAPRKGDNRELGVAVRSVDLEVSRVAPFGLVLVTLALGVGLLLAGRWVGFGARHTVMVSLGSMLLLTLYYQFDRFYSSMLVGWVALVVGLATFIGLYPRAFFPPVQNKNQAGRWYALNGGGWSLNLKGPGFGSSDSNRFGSNTQEKAIATSGPIGQIATTIPAAGENSSPKSLVWSYSKIVALVLPLLVVGLVFFEYGRVLDFGFFWDDYHIARPWPLGEVAGTFAGPWDALGLEPPYYRPLTVTSFALDWALYGFEPRGYHLTNLLFYSLAALLIYFLLRKLDLGWTAALSGALFFVISPPNVASAAWISQRSDALVAIFMLTGLIAFVTFCRTSKIYWLGLANTALVLALCCKEIAVALPFLYVLYWWFDGNNAWGRIFGCWKRLALVFGPAFVTLGLYLAWRALVLPAAVPDPDPAKRVNLETLWSGYHSAVYQSFYGLNNWLTEQAAPWLTLTLLVVMALVLLVGRKAEILVSLKRLGLFKRVGRMQLAPTNNESARGFGASDWRVLFFGLGWLLITCGPLAFLGASYSVTARVLFLPEIGYAIIAAALVALLVRFVGYSRGGWRFWPGLALLIFLLVAPYTPLHTANQRAQKDYAPGSFNTLRWDEWVYNNPAWKAKIPEQHYKAIEQKLREAGRI